MCTSAADCAEKNRIQIPNTMLLPPTVVPPTRDDEEEGSGWGVDDVLNSISKGLPIATHLFGVFGNRPELLQQNQQQNQNNQQLAFLLAQQNANQQMQMQNQNRNNWVLPVVIGVLVVGVILFLVLKK